MNKHSAKCKHKPRFYEKRERERNSEYDRVQCLAQVTWNKSNAEGDLTSPPAHLTITLRNIRIFLPRPLPPKLRTSYQVTEHHHPVNYTGGREGDVRPNKFCRVLTLRRARERKSRIATARVKKKGCRQNIGLSVGSVSKRFYPACHGSRSSQQEGLPALNAVRARSSQHARVHCVFQRDELLCEAE